MIKQSSDHAESAFKVMKDKVEVENEEKIILHTVCDGFIDDLNRNLHSCISLNIRNHVFLID
jgi:hypothetical protein